MNLLVTRNSLSRMLAVYCNLIRPDNCTVKDLFSIRYMHECPFGHAIPCKKVMPSDWHNVLCNYRVKTERGDEDEDE